LAGYAEEIFWQGKISPAERSGAEPALAKAGGKVLDVALTKKIKAEAANLNEKRSNHRLSEKR